MKPLALAALLLATAAAPAADDPIRPAIHFTPAANWINDPNGLVFYEGEWHLFYQYNPYGDRWGHMNWGHAVSRDLHHWTELGVAIPETEVMAFSGSAAIDWTNSTGLGKNGKPPMVAVWTGWTEATGHQAQYLSYSTDNGRTFTRVGTGPVLDIGSTEFRDPKIFWDAPRKRWVMAAVLANQNKVVLYTSPDLKKWSKASEFGPAGKRSREWECPDLFPLPVEGGGTKWVMIVNISADGPAGGSAGQYFVGDFDGTRFTPDSSFGDPSIGTDPQWLDRGADFYAGVTWNDAPAMRRVLIAWANDWRYARNIPTFPDRGAMSLPRELALRRTPAGYRLVHAPTAELAQALPERSRIENVALGATPTSLAIPDGPVDLTVEMDAARAHEAAFQITDPAGRVTLVGANPAVSELFLDRTRSSEHFHDAFPDRHTTKVPMPDGRVRFRLVVDRSVAELFADGGAATITDRFYPAPGRLRWSAWSNGGPATIRSVEVRYTK